MFGIVGDPVTPVAAAAQEAGIQYFGMRNEQSAAYAAQAVGYLTGRPGACLVVSGPGMTNAISGLANAQGNCWPMILIAGSADLRLRNMGAFQELPQIEASRPFVKFAATIEHVERIPFLVEQAVRQSIYGRPGAVYLDLPGDIITGTAEEEEIKQLPRVPDPPRSFADPKAIETAMEVLKSAERPVVIIGKGAAYSRAEDEITEFINRTQLPFLTTPMGKGVVSETHPLSVAA